MIHRGIKYSVVGTEAPGIWRWQFRIGDELKTGKTETRIELMAIRRAKLRIDRELKKKATRAPERSRRLAAIRP
jgi:hypothetical protein